MKSSIALILSLLIIGCGASSKTVKQEKEIKPPWEELDPDVSAFYIEQAACAEGTQVVKEAMTWPMSGAENIPESKIPRVIEVRENNEIPSKAFIQYRLEQNDKRVNELAILSLELGDIFLVDYYIFEAQRLGLITEDSGPEEIFSHATGEYFCFYN